MSDRRRIAIWQYEQELIVQATQSGKTLVRSPGDTGFHVSPGKNSGGMF